jgi:hypothetical protein
MLSDGEEVNPHSQDIICNLLCTVAVKVLQYSHALQMKF